MAKIDVYTTELDALSAKLKKAKQEVAEARVMVSAAQVALTMKVSSRSNIDAQMTTAKKTLSKQKSALGSMASLSAAAADEFANADKKSGKKSNNIISAITKKLGDLAYSTSKFIVSVFVSHHVALAGIFLSTGSILNQSLLDKLKSALGKVWDVITDIIKPTTKSDSDNSGITHQNGNITDSKDVPIPEPNTIIEKSGGHLVKFDSVLYGDKVSSNVQGEYTVVPNMRPEFVLNQKDIQKKTGQSGACTVCAYWTLGAAYMGGYENYKKYPDLKPEDGWVKGAGAANDGAATNPAKKMGNFQTEEEYLECIYNNLLKGNPVGTRMVSKTGASGHTVACIGMKNDTDIESFKSQLAALDKSAPDYKANHDKIIKEFSKNILISDSASGGKITTLDKYDFKLGKAYWLPDYAEPA